MLLRDLRAAVSGFDGTQNIHANALIYNNEVIVGSTPYFHRLAGIPGRVYGAMFKGKPCILHRRPKVHMSTDELRAECVSKYESNALARIAVFEFAVPDYAVSDYDPVRPDHPDYTSMGVVMQVHVLAYPDADYVIDYVGNAALKVFGFTGTKVSSVISSVTIRINGVVVDPLTYTLGADASKRIVTFTNAPAAGVAINIVARIEQSRVPHLDFTVRASPDPLKMILRCIISTDSSVPNRGTFGASLNGVTFSTPATQVVLFDKEILKGEFYRVGLHYRVSGDVSSFVRVMVNDQVMVDHRAVDGKATAGYIDGGMAYVKFGNYIYLNGDFPQASSDVMHRGATIYDCVDETLEQAMLDYDVYPARGGGTHAAWVGDALVRGSNTGGYANTAPNAPGYPCERYGPSISVNSIISPVINNLARRGERVTATNHGYLGLGLTSLAGRIVAWEPNLKVLRGDLVLPSVIIGADVASGTYGTFGAVPSGWMFRAESTGIMPATEPTWVVPDKTTKTAIINTVVGTITFTAVARLPSYVPGFIDPNDINFDPTNTLKGVISACTLSLAKTKIAVLMIGQADEAYAVPLPVFTQAFTLVEAYLAVQDIKLYVIAPPGVPEGPILSFIRTKSKMDLSIIKTIPYTNFDVADTAYPAAAVVINEKKLTFNDYYAPVV